MLLPPIKKTYSTDRGIAAWEPKINQLSLSEGRDGGKVLWVHVGGHGVWFELTAEHCQHLARLLAPKSGGAA